jgi:hypothetical protein
MKTKTNNLIKFIALAILGLFLVWFFFLKESREERLVKKGDLIVVGIEKFRNEFRKFPHSMEELGIKEEEGVDALYYQKRDSNNYILWFGTTLGESVTYYSDSKTWEDRNR